MLSFRWRLWHAALLLLDRATVNRPWEHTLAVLDLPWVLYNCREFLFQH